jgi:hypothetical protein
MDERHLRMSDTNYFARLQFVVAFNAVFTDQRSVPAVQVSQNPSSLRKKYFGVMATATFIFNYDLIGWRPTDCYRPSFDESKNVSPLRTFSNDEISEHLFEISDSSLKEPNSLAGREHRSARQVLQNDAISIVKHRNRK